MALTNVLIGFADEIGGGNEFFAINPATGEIVEPGYRDADQDQVDRACRLAAEAFPIFARLSPKERAGFLEAVADELVAVSDELIERAVLETALPRARLTGELARTTGQLRLFAMVVRQGDWLDVTIDPEIPDRQPAPRADIRRANMAIGPVAVFGASNFPLAFSVAGGDTASAFAAGCPVVVKGHPAHPGTGEMAARAICRTVQRLGLPEGVFSFLPAKDTGVGTALAAHPDIAAIAFTGSRQGGLALQAAANARPCPIPVFAEMSSINPVILLPAALEKDANGIASGYIASLTQGVGQFCTNPGLLLALAGPSVEIFIQSASEVLTRCEAASMLTPGIYAFYETSVQKLREQPGVITLLRQEGHPEINGGAPALFRTEASGFLANPQLAEEVFGPSSMIVICKDMTELKKVIVHLEGQLTATLMLQPEDEPVAAALIPLLESKVGRIICNAWPTGVEVSHAMVHGGPFPATTDSRTTSVGSAAIQRFLRPVCYQSVPDGLLPSALRVANPWQLNRRIDGVRER